MKNNRHSRAMNLTIFLNITILSNILARVNQFSLNLSLLRSHPSGLRKGIPWDGAGAVCGGGPYTGAGGPYTGLGLGGPYTGFEAP